MWRTPVCIFCSQLLLADGRHVFQTDLVAARAYRSVSRTRTTGVLDGGYWLAAHVASCTVSCNVYKPNRSCEAGHSKKGALCRLVDETCNGCGGVAWFTEISGGSQIVKDSRVATNDEAEADQVASFFSLYPRS